jgi:hypothetical protein
MVRAQIWCQEYVDGGYGETEREGEGKAERDFEEEDGDYGGDYDVQLGE